MKITRIRIKNFQQFKDFDLDLTYPMDYHDETKRGKPLDKVCFIGSNGTGKTTLLELIYKLIQFELDNYFNHSLNDNTIIQIDFVMHGIEYTNINIESIGVSKTYYLNKSTSLEIVEKLNQLIKTHNAKYIFDIPEFQNHLALSRNNWDEIHKNKFHKIFSPVDSKINYSYSSWVDSTNRNEASKLLKNKPLNHTLTFEHIDKFWMYVTAQVIQRKDARETYEELPENLKKSKEDLITEFNIIHPDFLEILSKNWDKILNLCGLFFDYKNAKVPSNLEKSLEVFIKLKKNHHEIPYNKLSTGIKHFIFRLGYLLAIYHEDSIKNSIVLFDEPENSLFVDFQRELVDIYTNPQNFPNTQFFFATHSPIIASQFDPAERIILDFDDEYFVTHRRGSAPEGDDVNDLLKRDFETPTMTEKGIEKWEEYVALKLRAKQTTDEAEKQKLIDEAYKIAYEYRFS